MAIHIVVVLCDLSPVERQIIDFIAPNVRELIKGEKENRINMRA